jgi:hypothetical protein
MLSAVIDPAAASGLYHGVDTVVISRSRLHELEACALRAELDGCFLRWRRNDSRLKEPLQKMDVRANVNARHIQLLQEQVTQAKDALAREQARGEKQAAAFVEVARSTRRHFTPSFMRHLFPVDRTLSGTTRSYDGDDPIFFSRHAIFYFFDEAKHPFCCDRNYNKQSPLGNEQ